MTTALALFGYAALLSFAGGRVLRGRSWVRRAPRLAIAMWQSSSGSVVLAVVLGGLVLTMPSLRLSSDITGLLDECWAAIRARYETPGEAAVGITGAMVALIVMARMSFCLARELVVAAIRRRRHVEVLALVGRPIPGLGAVVVDHGTPFAYCLPGRDRQIVLTSAALGVLSADQLCAVLSHEHAHLRGRHHLALAGAAGLVRAFPAVPLFQQADAEISVLVEMLADDHASRSYPRRTVAAALVALAGGPTPAGALSAAGPSALARVQRLTAPSRPLGLLRTGVAACGLGVALVAPVALAALPALIAAGASYCPL